MVVGGPRAFGCFVSKPSALRKVAIRPDDAFSVGL